MFAIALCMQCTPVAARVPGRSLVFITIMMTRSSNTHSLVLWLSACEMDSLIRWSLLNRWLMVIVSCRR